MSTRQRQRVTLELMRILAEGGGRLARREALTAYLFLLPNIVGFLLISLFPLMANIGISFTRWDILTAPRFVALKNYITMFKDPIFWKAASNTVIYCLGITLLMLVTSLFLALLLNQALRGILFFRMVYFLPVMTSAIAVGLIWAWIFDPGGLLNFLLFKLGLPRQEWLGESLGKFCIILVSVWRSAGYNMVILLAGLKSIPTEYYEAAEVDGANAWQKFRSVTLPLLTPSLFFVALISMIGSFKIFDQIYILTAGGPGNASTSLVFYMYTQGFEFLRMGYAAAIAVVLTVVIFVLTVIQWRGSRLWVFYD